LKRTRILLLGVTAMFADLVRAIVDADRSVEIVGDVADASELLAASAETDADVVLVTLADGDLPPSCRDLLAERPRMRILGLAGNARQGFLWELRPNRVALGEISPPTLLAALKGDARYGTNAVL
jgi:DNA-binding NarL/FixJ family response regulator